MIRCAIIVQNKAFGAAWRHYLVETHGFSENEIAFRFVGQALPASDGMRDFYLLKNWLVEQLEQATSPVPIRGLLTITDFDGDHLSGLNQLNPLASIADWRRILGMLILAFPEIHWILAGSVIRNQKLDDHSLSMAYHIPPEGQHSPTILGAVSLEQAGYTPLFDGSGLRNSIRAVIRSAAAGTSYAADLSIRRQCAAAIDDEINSSLLHAYTAYRFGFRSIPVSTLRLAKHLFDTKGRGGQPIHVVFEDIFIQFPDGNQSLSTLSADRKEQLPELERVMHRIFVTSLQRQPGDGIRWAANSVYLNEQRSHGQHIEVLPKPHAGIFTLWGRSGLAKRLSWVENQHYHRGVGEGYCWPPSKGSHIAKGYSHSTPGVLQSISNSLIERAQEIRSGVHSVKDAVRGAVLAAEALELLVGRSPTTSIDALSLKHEFEVIAECQFSGVEYHLNLAPRLKEIQRDVECISRFFHSSRRKTAALNAEMTIVSRLLLIFRENAQYEDEQLCMNRVRHLRNTLWMRHQPALYALWPLIRYIESLLASFPVFIVILLIWILCLSGLYVFCAPHSHWYLGLEDAITSFFSIGGPIHQGPATTLSLSYVSVICLAIVSGFVHLGIFVSHMYSLVVRK